MMAQTHTELVSKRPAENSAVLKSWLDVELSSTAVEMVICCRAPPSEGHGLYCDKNYDELLPPEPTRPPQLPSKGNLTLVVRVNSRI